MPSVEPKLLFVHTLPVPLKSRAASNIPFLRATFSRRVLSLEPSNSSMPTHVLTFAVFPLRTLPFDASTTIPNVPLTLVVLVVSWFS